MLEEALKNDKKNPSEVALSLLQFIQYELPAGGTSTEKRFFRLYKPMCDRIFGRILESKDGYRHADGGWMSTASTPRSNSSGAGVKGHAGYGIGNTSLGGSASNMGISGNSHLSAMHSSSSPFGNDPVAKFLGTPAVSTGKYETQTTLIEAISKETSNRPTVGFPLPFHAFPASLREAYLALLEASFGHTPTASAEKYSLNTQTLLMSLRRPPLEQKDLVAYKQSQAQKKESTAPLMQLSPRGFPVSSPQPSMASAKDAKPAEPAIIFGMLEYYLFLFFRFPLYPPVIRPSQASSAGVNVHRVSPSRGTSSSSSVRRGESLYAFLFGRYLKHFLPHEKQGSREISRESELFLRILITLWLESPGRPHSTTKVVNRHFRGDTGSLDLSSSYDLVMGEYDPPYMKIQKGLLALVKHLILDPALEVGDPSSYAMTKTMQILQAPFYNYIRMSFRTAEIHKPDTPFYTALEAWLVWLEPWNVTTRKVVADMAKNATNRLIGTAAGSRPSSRFLPSVKDDSASRFSSKWEAYVAANLHLYTVPLAIFLRRARELDFSPTNFKSSLQTVRRVFRVFSPALVECLNRLLQSNAPALTEVVSRHIESLGPYSPPNADQISLASCDSDMVILLEEVYLQHSKKSRAAHFSFKKVHSTEEKKLTSLLERARIMVKLPEDYQVTSKPPKSRTVGSTVDRPNLYSSDGKLTEDGFDKIRRGEVKCDPMDAVYQGDAMKSRLRDGEVEILRDIFVALSEMINEKSFIKVNLRFLAHRNTVAQLLASFIVLWLLKRVAF